jgi:hypothetical protein
VISHKDIQNVSYIKNKEGKRVNYYAAKELFWPFYLWRVTAPKGQVPLNIFQMLVLKLVRAGSTSIEKLSLYSNLDKELVRYILAQLTTDEYLTEWDLTAKAIILLDGKEANENAETGSYYLIQDAISGNLIPRVMTSLPFIENVDFSEKFPKFIESKGTGRISKPLLIQNTKPPKQPSAEQMSVCLRTYRRELNQLKQADVYVPEASENLSTSIEFIEESAISVFAHIRLFSTYGGERLWYLSDPTGLTISVPELNDAAEGLIARNKLFASKVNEVMGIAEEGKVVGYQEQQQKFEVQAQTELLSRYSWVQKYPLIEKHLLGMLRLKTEIQLEETPRFELVDSLLSELQRVLEAWLKTLIEPSESNTQWHIFVVEWGGYRPKLQFNKQVLKEIYLRVDGVSDAEAKQLSTVTAGRVQHALTNGGQSLKALLAAALIKAPNVIESINSKYPGWLKLAIDLAQDRNEFASHAGGKNIDKKMVIKHLTSVEKLLDLIEKFLGSK